ncbi:MAG: HNH endonuclease [Lachnospiraceae bacterium]|nr:HNH endonuclease [Lachnospiraceae bacterium]
MAKRAPIKTTIREAKEYWMQYIDECDLSVDWSEAESHCWRCGCERHLERCHIIPDSLGGKDEPANIVLLCKRCHKEGPNVSDPEIMWDWIKAYNVSLYNTFWVIQGMKEYEFIYKRSVQDELAYILEEAGYDEVHGGMEEVIKEVVRSAYQKASMHFGQPYFNTATMAGAYRMMLKELAEQYGVRFPEKKY